MNAPDMAAKAYQAASYHDTAADAVSFFVHDWVCACICTTGDSCAANAGQTVSFCQHQCAKYRVQERYLLFQCLGT